MPEIGDTKIGEYSEKYIWATCVDCGKERWTRLYFGKQAYQRCRKCGVRKTAIEYNGSNNPKWKGGITADMRSYRKEWRAKHREQICLYSHNRRAMKLNSLPNFTSEEWGEIKQRYSNSCACCGLKETITNLTVDHIIPLCKGGRHSKENIQPLCLSCNIHKARRVLRFDTHKKRQLVMVGV